MYKMIIADDENAILEGLNNLINWSEIGFEVVKTFENGEDVIDFLEYEPVDVVLTDIMMSNISGIDIAKYIQENKLNSKVVIISGYKRFELAQQAIRYGVEDFILKPTNANDIILVFQKIKKKLDMHIISSKKKRTVESQWLEMEPVLREKFIHSLILEGIRIDKKDIARRMQLLYPDINSEKSPCILATIKIEDYENFLHNKWNYSIEQFNESILNFMDFYKDMGYFHIIYEVKDIIRVFGIMKSFGNNPEEIKAICTNGTVQLIGQLKEVFELKVSLHIEQIFDNIYKVLDKRSDIFEYEEQQNLKLQLLEQKKLIITNITIRNIATAQKITVQLLRDYAVEDIQTQRNILIDILSDIGDVLQANHPNLYREIQPYINQQYILNIVETSALIKHCERIFDLMRSKNILIEKIDQNGLVDKIKNYVSEHIYDDIVLDDIANEVFICSTHIRRIFKKQTGETFLQYVTKEKMNKALELLSDPQYKVYQIGEMLGYKTTRYFSKLFYNFWGYYPNQYRKEVLKLGETADEN